MSQEPKLCKDCRYYSETDFFDGIKAPLTSFCLHGVFATEAKYIRSGACGKEGKYWGAKDE